MIIQTNIWHFTLYRLTFNHQPDALRPTNLCAYVRRIALITPFVFLLAMVSLPVFLLSYITYALGAALFGVIYKEAEPLREAFPKTLASRYCTWVVSREMPQFIAVFAGWGGFLLAGIQVGLILHQQWPALLAVAVLPLFTPVLGGALILILITAQGIGLGVKRIWGGIVDRLPERPERQGESLLISYIRAKKARVCPRISFSQQAE